MLQIFLNSLRKLVDITIIASMIGLVRLPYQTGGRRFDGLPGRDGRSALKGFRQVVQRSVHAGLAAQRQVAVGTLGQHLETGCTY